MPVPTVLAQRRAGLPEPGVRIIRLRQRQIRRTKGVTGWLVRRHDRREQVAYACGFPCIDQAGQHNNGAPAAGRQCLLWTDQIPDRRQRTLDHHWGKRIEESYHRRWADRAQRRRSPGEVSPPEAPQAGLFELGACLSGKISGAR
jgi:hypothetical protein